MLQAESSVTCDKWTRSKIEIERDYEVISLEKEFSIIFNSALAPDIPQEIHYVNRARKMSLKDPKNFYSLAAATVVACFGCNYSKLNKYHAISSCLINVRMSLNCNSLNELAVMEKIEELADSIIDIFDCEN
jgi:hypothetical protein